MTNLTASSTGCCPRFDPNPWEGRTITWEKKSFITDSVRCVFHIPLTMGKVITRMWQKIHDAHAEPQEFLLLANDSSPWKTNVFIPVSKEVPGINNVSMSGTFVSKVFEGPFRNARTWCEEMKRYVASQGKEIRNLYLYYTTCPKCAKEYGKNYVVLLADITAE